jgi:hypothetical protein
MRLLVAAVMGLNLSGDPVECTECGAEADEHAIGWRGYRAELPEDEEPELKFPEIAFYCPVCAEREFGPLRRSSPKPSLCGRTWSLGPLAHHRPRLPEYEAQRFPRLPLGVFEPFEKLIALIAHRHHS